VEGFIDGVMEEGSWLMRDIAIVWEYFQSIFQILSNDHINFLLFPLFFVETDAIRTNYSLARQPSSSSDSKPIF
jgi:hypothetical protein